MLTAASFAHAQPTAYNPQTIYKIESAHMAYTGYYNVFVRTGRVLEVANASTANGAKIRQWDYLGGANQQWIIQPVGNGLSVIRNINSGKVLDVTGFSKENGASVQQWDYNITTNQQWAIEGVDQHGIVRIRNFNSGKVLDSTGRATNSGAWIQQWDYSGGDYQRWLLVPVGTFQPPACDSITNSGSPAAGNSFEVYANNVRNAVSVLFPTWTVANGQDELIWYEGTYDAANNRWKCIVEISDHKNEVGVYKTDAYAVGVDDKVYGLGGTAVTVTAPPMGIY